MNMSTEITAKEFAEENPIIITQNYLYEDVWKEEVNIQKHTAEFGPPKITIQVDDAYQGTQAVECADKIRTMLREHGVRARIWVTGFAIKSEPLKPI